MTTFSFRVSVWPKQRKKASMADKTLHTSPYDESTAQQTFPPQPSYRETDSTTRTVGSPEKRRELVLGFCVGEKNSNTGVETSARLSRRMKKMRVVGELGDSATRERRTSIRMVERL